MARATLDKSGNVAATRERPVGGTSRRIYFPTDGVHACVFRTCARTRSSRGQKKELDGRAGGWRGWSWPHERTHTTGNATGKEAKIDLPGRAYLADTRFIRSSCYFPLRRAHLSLRSCAPFPRCCGRGTKGRRRRFFGETRRLIIVRTAVSLGYLE